MEILISNLRNKIARPLCLSPSLKGFLYVAIVTLIYPAQV